MGINTGKRLVEKTINTKNFTVEIHSDLHGCFEHNDFGDECAGELWFDPMGELVDYDGVFDLPEEVKRALKDAGFFGESL